MEYICKNDLCTGCTACCESCPTKAISMIDNNEGFLYPTINNELCINCGLCKKVCPANNYKFNNFDQPIAYAAMADDALRKVSSSGGAFSILAKYILGKNGIVCGAAFDDDMIVCHQIVETKDDLQKLRGSKYVQSNMKDIYKKLKEYLENNRLVLFTGCPCQVAGLKNYLNKNYENLITADLICHGVPSPKVFAKYLEEEFYGQKVLNVNFRDKKDGWGGNGITTTTTTITGVYSKKDFEDTYLTAFFANISLRKSCYNCKYTKLPRVGDFTLADCWGATKDIDDKKGTSTLLLNNNKAIEIFNEIKQNFKLLKEIPFNKQVQIQPQLKYPVAIHPARNDFFAELDTKTLKENLTKNLCSDKNVAILNFHWENVNFGALLTSFALNCFLNKSGFNAQNINYIPHFPWIEEEEPNKYFDDFRAKYLPVTKKYTEPDELTELNEFFKHFVVGSDQVWRYAFIKKDLKAYFFDFANLDKNLISCAASFGTDDVKQQTGEANEIYEKYLSLFNSISIREQSGVDYCNQMGIKTDCIFDPVFMLDLPEWNKIFEDFKYEKNNIVFYTINEEFEPQIVKFINNNKNILNTQKIKNITFKTSVEEWLYQIKNCDFFIADSFHGVCFAIIFNKPFICVNKNIITSTRMKNLLDKLGIENRLFDSFEKVDLTLLNDINYDEVNKKIEEYSIYAKNWLINSLTNYTDKTKEKEKIKKEILTIEYEIAKKNIFKYWVRYNKYKIQLKICKKNDRIRNKYEVNKSKYKQYKNTIKIYKKSLKGNNEK